MARRFRWRRRKIWTSVRAARQTGEPHRVWKIRIVDVLEGKTARILAILLLIAAILILALVMSQTA